MRPRTGTYTIAGMMVTITDKCSFAFAADAVHNETPGAAPDRAAPTSIGTAGTAAQEPAPERIDQVTELLDEIGRPVTEEALHAYGEMSDEVFNTIARDLRDAYRRARHPPQPDAERRARETGGRP